MGTYHRGEQQRFRRACATDSFARALVVCTYNIIMDIEETTNVHAQLKHLIQMELKSLSS